MPTKDVYNAVTGLTETVEMTGAELAAYEAMRAVPDPAQLPSKNEILLSLLDGLEPGDEATEVILLVQQEMLRP